MELVEEQGMPGLYRGCPGDGYTLPGARPAPPRPRRRTSGSLSVAVGFLLAGCFGGLASAAVEDEIALPWITGKFSATSAKIEEPPQRGELRMRPSRPCPFPAAYAGRAGSARRRGHLRRRGRAWRGPRRLCEGSTSGSAMFVSTATYQRRPASKCMYRWMSWKRGSSVHRSTR